MVETCVAASLSGLLLLGSAAPAFAADIQKGDSVVIGPDQVVNDDVYALSSGRCDSGCSTWC